MAARVPEMEAEAVWDAKDTIAALWQPQNLFVVPGAGDPAGIER